MTCPACLTTGDLIVRRASAGAAVYDAERALSLAGRTGTVEQRAAAIEAATDKLAQATATYETALRDEQAAVIRRREDGPVGPSFLPAGVAVSQAVDGGSDYREPAHD